VRTLNRYLLREIAIPFGLGLAIVTLILLIARILKLVELVVNRGVPLLQVLKLFSYILPAFLELTVPMALLLAVLVAFGRLSSDSELIAMNASGVSLYQLLAPVAVFAAAVYVVSLGLSLYARPWGNSLLRSALFDIARTRAGAAIKEKVFTDDFPGLVIYVDHIEPPGNRLHGVLISDTRDAAQRNTVFAEMGLLVQDEETKTMLLRLLGGTMHAFYQKDASYPLTRCRVYDITLDLTATLDRARRQEKDVSEMTIPELRRAMAAKRSAGQPTFIERVELQRKFSIPFASLVFAAVAVPLGIRPTRAVRSRGLTLSLVIIFVYYLLLTLGDNLGSRGALPAWVAMWLPNALLAIVALVLFVHAAQGPATAAAGLGVPWLVRLRARVAWRAGARTP
jgi:lipopolysaccharide export system permease protein